MCDHYRGCFLGLALGDAFGAPYEGDIFARILWQAIGRTRQGERRYTDDTQMSIDIAHVFLKHGDFNQDILANEFASSYRGSRGYGPAAGKLLKKIQQGYHWKGLNKHFYKDGSFGNGAAMRAPIVAMCMFNQPEKLVDAIHQCSEITHAHPLAIEGAALVALACQYALKGYTANHTARSVLESVDSSVYRNKMDYANQWVNQETQPSKKEIIAKMGNSMSAAGSTITAIYFALRYLDKRFEEMLEAIIALRGDTDTIAAMAGAIWGASNGSNRLNKDMINNLENARYISQLSTDIFERNAQ